MNSLTPSLLEGSGVRSSIAWKGTGVRFSILSLVIVLVGSALYPSGVSNILVLVGFFGILISKSEIDFGIDRFKVLALPLVLCSIVFLSVFWSSDEKFTRLSAVFYICLAAAVSIAAHKLTVNSLLVAASYAFRIILVVSWSLVLLGSQSAMAKTDTGGFAIKGIFVHRNLFGTVCVLATLTFFFAWRSNAVRGLSTILWISISTLSLFLSDSRTSMVVLFVTSFSCFLLYLSARSSMSARMVGGVSVVLALSVICSVIVAPLGEISMMLGRSRDLTGRTEIWQAVLVEIKNGSIWGSGFMASWRSNDPATLRIWQSIGFRAAHAHNGYLDILLQLGVLGVALAIIVLVLLLFRSVLLVRSGSSLGYFAFAFSVSQIVYNLTETRLTFGASWALLFLVYAKVYLELKGREDQEGNISSNVIHGLNSNDNFRRNLQHSKDVHDLKRSR